MISIEDRLLIHELLARLDHAVDRGDWSTYLDHFTPDAVMDTDFGPPVQGTEALRGFLVANEGGTSGKRHVATNIVLDSTDEGVRATSYLTVIEREDIPKVVATALITDEFVRAGGAWKVRRHEVRIDPGMMKAFAAQQAS